MTKTNGLFVLAALALLILFAAAACGSDEEAAAVDSLPPSATALPTSASMESEPPPTATPAPTATPEPTAAPTEDVSERPKFDREAPELTGINGWINSEPLTLESQRGKVVLIDFWTYTCINCIRTLPYIKEWHAKYADKGLVILGVHTPEFEFEKIRENVIDAVEEFGLEYPVLQDNDFGTWNAFENRYWPAKYLIDKDGYVRYTHFGEGAYAETELQIRELLEEAGFDLSMVAPNSDPDPLRDMNAMSQDPSTGQTRELYAGTRRNFGALYSQTTPPYVLHEEYFQETDADVLYVDPGEHPNHFLFLNGLWTNKEESLVHARQTEGHDDYIALMFYATSVNVVMASTDLQPLDVRVTVDDAPMDPERAGVDVMFDDEGNSYIRVDESRMYRVVNMDAFGGHELKLSSTSPNMELFAFTFGGYEGGEPSS